MMEVSPLLVSAAEGIAMTRLLASCLVLLTLATGCAMCEHCDDYLYSVQGGKNPRMNLHHGRVHSLYDPADGETISHETTIEEGPPAQPEPAPTTTTSRGRWSR